MSQRQKPTIATVVTQLVEQIENTVTHPTPSLYRQAEALAEMGKRIGYWLNEANKTAKNMAWESLDSNEQQAFLDKAFQTTV